MYVLRLLNVGQINKEFKFRLNLDVSHNYQQ